MNHVPPADVGAVHVARAANEVCRRGRPVEDASAIGKHGLALCPRVLENEVGAARASLHDSAMGISLGHPKYSRYVAGLAYAI